MLSCLLTLALVQPATLESPGDDINASLKHDAAVEIPLTIRNATDRPISVWSAGFWPNHSLHLTDSSGRVVAQTTKGLNLQAIFSNPASGRDKNVEIAIAKHKTYRYATPPIHLAQLFNLTPGRYGLVVEYWDRREARNLRMKTKALKVVVTP